MSTARRELVWKIKKKLFRLSSDDIYRVAKDLATDSQETVKLSPSDEESCMDYVVSYMQSDTLLNLEDEGMSQLLMMNDLVCKVINTCTSVDSPVDVDDDVVTHVLHSSSPLTINPDHRAQPHSQSNSTTMQSHSHPNTYVPKTTQ